MRPLTTVSTVSSIPLNQNLVPDTGILRRWLEDEAAERVCPSARERDVTDVREGVQMNGGIRDDTVGLIEVNERVGPRLGADVLQGDPL